MRSKWFVFIFMLPLLLGPMLWGVAHCAKIREFPGGIKVDGDVTISAGHKLKFLGKQVEVYPEDYGKCVADNSTDCGPAIRAALAASTVVKFSQGTYKIASGGIDLAVNANVNGIQLLGAGQANTVLHFTDSSRSSLIHVGPHFLSNFRIEGMTILGPGVADGNVTGIMHSRFETSCTCSYDWTFRDLSVQNVSRDGIYVTSAFQTLYERVSARYIGRDGIVSAGDQGATFIDTGQYMTGIGRWCYWIQAGAPFMQNINMGAVANGVKFGREASDPGGAAPCYPTVHTMNIEWVDNNGTGIEFANGNFVYGSNISIYAPLNYSPTGHVDYGIRWKNMGAMGVLSNVNFIGDHYPGSGFGAFRHYYYVDGVAGNGDYSGILYYGDNPADLTTYHTNFLRYDGAPAGPTNAEQLFVTTYVRNGTYNTRIPVQSPGFHTTAGMYGNHRKISHGATEWSRSLYRGYEDFRAPTRANDSDAVLDTRTSGTRMPDYIVDCNATLGAFDVLLDYAGYMSERILIIKKIDGTANAVTVHSQGPTRSQSIDDNATNSVLHFDLGAYEAVTMFSDGDRWYRIGGYKP